MSLTRKATKTTTTSTRTNSDDGGWLSAPFAKNEPLTYSLLSDFRNFYVARASQLDDALTLLEELIPRRADPPAATAEDPDFAPLRDDFNFVRLVNR
ncbi:MAG TPA: hypothetical protein VIT43_05035 [Candidatus Dormibacteraeota bacterium]